MKSILVTGLCTLHWGRLQYGNIGNYYIVEPLFRQLHKHFPDYKIVTTFQMDEQFIRKEDIEVVPMELYYAWNEDDVTNVSWENSDMYKGLNGSYFLANTTYDYLQNTTWSNKIENWTWSAVNTKTFDKSSGPYYSKVTTQEMYLHEMNRTGKASTVGEWTNPVAKIGLMYASDYTLSLGSSALAIAGSTSANQATLKTGWMNQSNNDTAKSQYEWTLSRYGAISSGNFNAWFVNSDGRVDGSSVNYTSGACPVFYLTSNQAYLGGNGSLDDPFMIQ